MTETIVGIMYLFFIGILLLFEIALAGILFFIVVYCFSNIFL